MLLPNGRPGYRPSVGPAAQRAAQHWEYPFEPAATSKCPTFFGVPVQTGELGCSNEQQQQLARLLEPEKLRTLPASLDLEDARYEESMWAGHFVDGCDLAVTGMDESSSFELRIPGEHVAITCRQHLAEAA